MPKKERRRGMCQTGVKVKSCSTSSDIQTMARAAHRPKDCRSSIYGRELPASERGATQPCKLVGLGTTCDAVLARRVLVRRWRDAGDRDWQNTEERIKRNEDEPREKERERDYASEREACLYAFLLLRPSWVILRLVSARPSRRHVYARTRW